MRLTPVAVGAVALAFVLSSCATPSTHETTVAADPGTTTPASATPTSAVQDPADPATWIISAQGVGPLLLGEKAGDAALAVPGYRDVTDRNACPNTRVTFIGPAGTSSQNAPILLLSDDSGSLAGVALSAVGPKTSEGVGVGSVAADVKAAYPAAVPGKRGATDVFNLLTVHGSPGWISYELTDDSVRQVDLISGGLPPNEFCN